VKGFATLSVGIVAASTPKPGPALRIACDFRDEWPLYRPVMGVDFLLADFRAGSFVSTPGTFAGTLYARPTSPGLGLAVDLLANSYAAPSYSRSAVTGLGLSLDFKGQAYRGQAYTRATISPLSIYANFKTPAYAG
jgi:hypothetical protein